MLRYGLFAAGAGRLFSKEPPRLNPPEAAYSPRARTHTDTHTHEVTGRGEGGGCGTHARHVIRVSPFRWGKINQASYVRKRNKFHSTENRVRARVFVGRLHLSIAERVCIPG